MERKRIKSNRPKIIDGRNNDLDDDDEFQRISLFGCDSIKASEDALPSIPSIPSISSYSSNHQSHHHQSHHHQQSNHWRPSSFLISSDWNSAAAANRNDKCNNNRKLVKFQRKLLLPPFTSHHHNNNMIFVIYLSIILVSIWSFSSPFSSLSSSSSSSLFVGANSIVGIHVEHFPHNFHNNNNNNNHSQQQNHHRKSDRSNYPDADVNDVDVDQSINHYNHYDIQHNNQDHHIIESSNNRKSSNEIHGTPLSPVSIKPDLFGLITEVNVECNSNLIQISLIAPNLFNGMIYPKGLSKNSSCMSEYYDVTSFNYSLPLRACNTMSMEVDDGIEYFNTVIVQPHRRLVTNQGRGYHIRCRYQTKDKRLTNQFNLTISNNFLNSMDTSAAGGGNNDANNGNNNNGRTETTQLYGMAPVPTSSMKIYHQGTQKEIIADNVKIGDRLTLTISIEQQPIYGMKITNCLVRDGLNWGEQPLINDEGCPVDKEIMGPFEYTKNLTKASVSFHAHKFPYTSSVYYQCNVRLCLKDDDDGCNDVPPSCDQNGRNYRHKPPSTTSASTTTTTSRSRRDTYDAVVIPDINRHYYQRQQQLNNPDPNQHQYRAMAQRLQNKMDKDLSMEVYSGLYVDENEENTPELDDELEDGRDSGVGSTGNNRGRGGSGGGVGNQHDPNEFCISMRKFAIGVAIASLLLMLAVLLLVICILQRRRRRHHHNNSQHSINSNNNSRLFNYSHVGGGGGDSTIGNSSIYSGSGGGGGQYNRAYSRD